MKILLRELYNTPLTKLLFEQEEDDAATEDTEEEGAEEEGVEEEGDEESAPEDEDKGSESESDEEEDLPQEETPGSSIDDDIEAVLIDFEASARSQAQKDMSESLSFLYENTEEIDLDSFAADVARLIKNYDNLMDIESILLKKSTDFVQNRYGEEASDSFLDKLETQHDINVEDNSQPEPGSVLDVPLAIGASSAGE